MSRIIRHLAPLTATSGRGNTRTHITVHETANRSRGAGAWAHARLQAGGNSRAASWHYQVDDKHIIQSFDDNVRCWHAGARANRSSISIEICVNSDSDYAKAVANAAWLVGHLMKKYRIPASRVVTHNYWTGKNCPTIMLKQGGFNGFVKRAQGVVSGKTSVSTATAKTRVSKARPYRVKRTNRYRVAVKKGRYRTSATLGFLNSAGYRVNVVKTSGSWTQIRYQNRNAWVPTAHLNSFFEDERNKYGVAPAKGVKSTNKPRVPVFLTANSKSRKLGTLHTKGYRVNVNAMAGNTGSWTRIRYASGNGWVRTTDLI